MAEGLKAKGLQPSSGQWFVLPRFTRNELYVTIRMRWMFTSSHNPVAKLFLCFFQRCIDIFQRHFNPTVERRRCLLRLASMKGCDLRLPLQKRTIKAQSPLLKHPSSVNK